MEETLRLPRFKTVCLFVFLPVCWASRGCLKMCFEDVFWWQDMTREDRLVAGGDEEDGQDRWQKMDMCGFREKLNLEKSRV